MNLFVVEALRWTDEDQRVLERTEGGRPPIILVLNKVDKVHPKERLLPFIEELTQKAEFAEIVPLSAKGKRTWTTAGLIARHLPESPPHFPKIR